MRVDLYEDEVGGLYMHREDDPYVLPVSLTVVADPEDSMRVQGANVFEALAVELEALAGTGDHWSDVERPPMERPGSAALVATYADSKVQVQDGSGTGTAPPGPNALRALRDLGSGC